MKTQLTPELLKQLYTNEGKTAQQIAQQTDYCEATILYHLRKFNIPTRKEWWLKGRPKITKEFLEEEYVLKQKPMEQIAKETGYERKKIWRAMQKFGIKTRVSLHGEQIQSHYALIDVGNMNWAYIAGFIDAEGTVYRRRYLHRVSIVNTNREVMEKIRAFVGYGTLTCRTIKHLGKKPIYTLDFTRKEIAQKLSGDLVLKKQKVEELFGIKLAQPTISWAYIAGLFDGDGSVTFYEKIGRCVMCIISQDFNFLSIIQGWLCYGRIYKHGTGFMLKIGRHKDQSNFCEHTIPYLIIQKNKMEKAQSFIENKNWDFGHKLLAYPESNSLSCTGERECRFDKSPKSLGVSITQFGKNLKNLESCEESQQ